VRRAKTFTFATYAMVILLAGAMRARAGVAQLYGAGRAAPAFFHNVYGQGFHCEAGRLVVNDPASGVMPNFLFAFRNSDGLAVTIDLAGEQPKYSGGLAVDSGAKTFFDRVWKLCHCQAQ
jgi:hypothetical protein